MSISTVTITNILFKGRKWNEQNQTRERYPSSKKAASQRRQSFEKVDSVMLHQKDIAQSFPPNWYKEISSNPLRGD